MIFHAQVTGPTQYRRTLKDVVVAVRFTLKHWAFNSTDTNIADIVNIRVLVPPKDPLTPRRRKLELIDPSPFDSKSNGSESQRAALYIVHINSSI